MKLRKFKTRNGSIIKEWPHGTSVIKNGYIDDYKIIKSIGNKEFKNGDYICLFLSKIGKPLGGAQGKGWDIIEEVLSNENLFNNFKMFFNTYIHRFFIYRLRGWVINLYRRNENEFKQFIYSYIRGKSKR